jgi:3'(2'), 5'-bisphosphate nucleotidase
MVTPQSPVGPGTTLAREALLAAVVAVAREAGSIVMQVYDAGGGPARMKADASPVTQADERAEAHIVPALQALLPEVPVVAEEAFAQGRLRLQEVAAAPRFWLVDPLDGTREFLARNGEFTVNIALVEAGRPVLGVVLVPAEAPAGTLYLGAVGLGAWRVRGAEAPQPIAVRREPAEGLTLVSSRSHDDATALETFLAGYLRGRRIASRRPAGSSLKLCLVACGQADLYPRLGRTMEWDIAAGHAVLAAAGGRVLTLEGEPLRYGKPGFENPAFVAVGGG